MSSDSSRSRSPARSPNLFQDWKLDTGHWHRQNVVPTANRNLHFFSGCRLLSSTPSRLRVHRENQPERHVQHRHEEADLRAGRRLERARPGRPLRSSTVRRERQRVEDVERIAGCCRRSAAPCTVRWILSSFQPKFWPLSRTWPASANSTRRTGPAMLIRYSALNSRLLLPPRTMPGRRVARPDGADVEAADAVFAAEIQPLVNRQHRVCCRTAGCTRAGAEAERGPAVERDVPDAFDARVDEVGVAAEPGDVERQRVARAAGREDRLVDRVVDPARRILLIVRLPPRPISSESCRNGLRCSTREIVVERVQVLDLDALAGCSSRTSARTVPIWKP